MATHSSILPWKFPWTEKPGQAVVHGLAKSQTWLNTHSTQHEKHYDDLVKKANLHEKASSINLVALETLVL